MVTSQREYEGTVKKGMLRIMGQLVGGLISFILLVCVWPVPARDDSSLPIALSSASLRLKAQVAVEIGESDVAAGWLKSSSSDNQGGAGETTLRSDSAMRP
jgi:hypothetical protein